MSSGDLAGLVERIPQLRAPVVQLTGGDESPAAVAAAVAFVLEGLHLSKRLNKDTSGSQSHVSRPQLILRGRLSSALLALERQDPEQRGQ